MAHTSRLLSALPIKEYLGRIGHLNELARELPGGIGGAGTDARQAALKLKAENIYPPGLERACAERLLGKEPVGYDDCDLDSVLGISQVSKGKPKRDPVAKAIEKALARFDAETAALRKSINDYKARAAADYLAAGLPIPASLNLPKELHPETPAAAKLEKQAEEYRNTAARLSEPELRQHFLAKARVAEEEAEEIRRGI